VDKLFAKAKTLLAVPYGRILEFTSRGAPENDAPSSPQTRADCHLDLIPRHHIIRESVIVRDTAIQFGTLLVGKRKSLRVGTYSRPYLFDERQPFLDVESIYAQALDGNTHGHPPHPMINLRSRAAVSHPTPRDFALSIVQ
jgi:hypothetical protein